MRKNLDPGALQLSMATYSSSVSGEQPRAWLTVLPSESVVCGGFLTGPARISSLAKDVVLQCPKKLTPCKGPWKLHPVLP